MIIEWFWVRKFVVGVIIGIVFGIFEIIFLDLDRFGFIYCFEVFCFLVYFRCRSRSRCYGDVIFVYVDRNML